MKKKLLLALGVLLIFSLMVAGPAVSTEDLIKGVCVGGGEFVNLTDVTSWGNTHFSLRANFPENAEASGGMVYVAHDKDSTQYPGLWVLIDVENLAILDGSWELLGGGDVSGYAMWGIGPIVDSSVPALVGMWALCGAYDGDEKTHDMNNMDYLMISPGLDQSTASNWYEAIKRGLAPGTFYVYQNKGNVTLKVQKVHSPKNH